MIVQAMIAGAMLMCVTAAAAAGLATGQPWRPFLDPLPLHGAWLVLLAPVVVALAVVYKAIKLPRIEHFGREVAVLSVQVVGLLVLAAVVLWAVTELV
jgi:hypothetical protein